MTRRFVIFSLLALSGLSVFADTSSACWRRSSCCYVECCYCPPCECPCYCIAYRDPYKKTGAIWVWCRCCHSHDTWAHCYVYITGSWEWVKIRRCYYNIPFDKEAKEAEGFDKVSTLSSRATVVVTLPADAKLTIEDEVMTSTTGTRTFTSPPLEHGKNYTYTLKAEIVREGKTLSTTREVRVKRGEDVRVSLDIPTATVAAK